MVARELINTRGIPRRKWQLFAGVRYPTRFLLTSPMFERKTPFTNVNASIDYDLNPEISKMLTGQNWLANPHRVKFFSYENGSLIHLSESAKPTLAQGDVIWFSFTLQYVVNHTWGPDVQVVDVVRVGHGGDSVPRNVSESRGPSARGVVSTVDTLNGMLHSRWHIALVDPVYLSVDDVEIDYDTHLHRSMKRDSFDDFEFVDDIDDPDAPVCGKRKWCDEDDSDSYEVIANNEGGTVLLEEDEIIVAGEFEWVS